MCPPSKILYTIIFQDYQLSFTLCPPTPFNFSSTVQEVPESNRSTSLEDVGITVTRTTSVENLEDYERRGSGREIRGHRQTDHLSQSYSHPSRTPTPPKATPPLPPHTARPHSVADFRHRRYRRTATESTTTQWVQEVKQLPVTFYDHAIPTDLCHAHIKSNNYFPVTHTKTLTLFVQPLSLWQMKHMTSTIECMLTTLQCHTCT